MQRVRVIGKETSEEYVNPAKEKTKIILSIMRAPTAKTIEKNTKE
jgi:hypothetical protein